MSQIAPVFWYAEDDEDDRFLFKEIVSTHDTNVCLEMFSSGEELIKKVPAYVSNNLPDLIILDLNMPGLSGIELIPVLRAFPKFNETKIAVLTTSSLSNDREAAERNDVLFLTKPMVYSDYTKILNQLFAYTFETEEVIK